MSPPESRPQLEYPYAARPAAPFQPLAPPAAGTAFGPSWIGLIGLAALFVIVNFSVIPLIELIDDDSFIVVGCMGVMLAEGFVLAAWLVWGGGSFLLRLVRHWALALLLGAIWLLGALVAEGARDRHIRDVLENVPVSLPLASLAIQIPLWIARLYFGWRLVDECADPAPARPLAIRDFMFGTVIVAVSLAAARLAEEMLRHSSEGWLMWAVLVPSLAGISLVSVLPVAVWLLRMRDLSIGLICVPIQTTIAILVTVIIIAMVEPRVRLEEVLIIATIIVSFAATLSLAALAARAAGFSLKTDRGRDPRANDLSVGNAP
jgi:hypothetical protein